MNKSICIFLCILLICLSICPVFADSTNFTDKTEFCNAINQYITITSPPSDQTYFVDSFYNERCANAFNSVVSNFNINTSNIICVMQQAYSTQARLDVLVASSEFPTAGNPINLSSGTLMAQFYFAVPSTIHRYYIRDNGGTITYNDTEYSNINNLQFSSYSFNNRSTWRGIIPYKLTFSPTANDYSTLYYLNMSNDGGGDNPIPSYNFSSVTMSIPAILYANLYNTYMYARWQEISNKWSTEYANASDFEWVFDNNEDAQIFASIMGVGSILESYSVNSYTFYDNVSQNLANGMTMLSSLNSNIDNMANDINLLADVYASDQEIEAREAAADNQQSIVDNFLDSEGEGYVSPSDISSVSSMSDGYKTNMSTDANPSGIWDIFNSNHFGWFSQETVNQLDTTTSNQRGLNNFETPYLDEKIRDIYKSLGVNYDD